jgi:acetolactate synthase-1/2/3 large subunit
MGQTTGGEVIARMLQAEGITKIFGIIDGTYTQFYVSAKNLGMDIITPRHEATAPHMAGAYARLTGGLGVCMASSGPGVANVLPGVVVENAEGNRVLLITSSRRPPITNPDRGGAYQFFDQVATIKPIAKWSARADSFDRVPELLRRALRISYRGRPGLVHLDVPETVMNGKHDEIGLWDIGSYRRQEPVTPPSSLVEKAADMLAAAEFPIIHAGSGIIHAAAYDELAAVAEALESPVTTSWSARGVLSEDSPLAWPMIHVAAVNEVRNAADLVLCLGSRLGETDWWGKPPYWRAPAEQQMIQVDMDEDNLGMNKPAVLPVLGDVKLFLAALLEALETRDIPVDTRRARVAKLTETKSAHRAKLDEKLTDVSSPMLTGHVAVTCRQVFDDDAVVVFDGGNTNVWANFFHLCRAPNTILSTHHFGMLGAGLGQALGAAAARPDKQVYCIIGDGAFGFHPQEIETAVRHKLPIVFIVCADKQWGMVKINQQATLKPIKTLFNMKVRHRSLPPEDCISTDLGEVAWDHLGKALGAHGERVSDPAELKPALERALASGKCAVVQVDVHPDKHLWAPGLIEFKDMHKEPGGK